LHEEGLSGDELEESLETCCREDKVVEERIEVDSAEVLWEGIKDEDWGGNGGSCEIIRVLETSGERVVVDHSSIRVVKDVWCWFWFV
jgi:hypothetical protein